MNIQLAKFIQNAVEHIGEEAEIREDYSGRGMMGRQTVGVVVDHEKFIIQGLLEFFKEFPNTNGIKNIRIDDLRFDNMGRGIIVY